MNKEFNKKIKLVKALLMIAFVLFVLDIGLFMAYLTGAQLPSIIVSKKDTAIISSLDPQEAILIDDVSKDLVVANCTSCHSANLIAQNRATREGWISTIRWMQKTQNLWDLGESEAAIVDYLAKNYAPQKRGRRANLENVEWYELR